MPPGMSYADEADDTDGLSAEEMFTSRYGYAYDDIIVLPGSFTTAPVITSKFIFFTDGSISVSTT